MTEADFERLRRRLVAEVAADAERTADYTHRASFGTRVMAALGQVPRERFVPDSAWRSAYDNRPLAIGHRRRQPPDRRQTPPGPALRGTWLGQNCLGSLNTLHPLLFVSKPQKSPKVENLLHELV